MALREAHPVLCMSITALPCLSSHRTVHDRLPCSLDYSPIIPANALLSPVVPQFLGFGKALCMFHDFVISDSFAPSPCVLYAVCLRLSSATPHISSADLLLSGSWVPWGSTSTKLFDTCGYLSDIWRQEKREEKTLFTESFLLGQVFSICIIGTLKEKFEQSITILKQKQRC